MLQRHRDRGPFVDIDLGGDTFIDLRRFLILLLEVPRLSGRRSRGSGASYPPAVLKPKAKYPVCENRDFAPLMGGGVI
jgi:hypothetical protein